MRYLPLSADDRRAMLKAIGIAHIDELFADVPAGRLLEELPSLPSHKGEMEVEAEMAAMAARNLAASQARGFFLGAGAYRHHVPATVDHLIQRSEFLTAYTPYQPEISQGTLQVLFEFQTQVAMLTGMEVANASMYDGSTAAAEAVLMARRLTRRKRAVLAGNIHPHYQAAIENLMGFSGGQVDAAAPAPEGAASGDHQDLAAMIDDQTACVVVQIPDFFGHIHDFSALAEAAHARKALLVVIVGEIISLGALIPPGEMGADIVVGEGQSLGCGLNFGGPYLGLFACRQKHVRQMPGRLCGQTLDADGRRGFVLTLSTREQHIRREKATSNICTNSGLMALAFSIHLSLLGEKGLRELAMLNHARALQLAKKLAAIKGVELLNKRFFNEFTLRLPRPAAGLVDELAEKGLIAGLPVSRLLAGGEYENLLLVAATEINNEAQMDALADGLKEAVGRA